MLILKILGIIILVIICLILFILGIVLFSPIRYKVTGGFHSELSFSAKATYLFGLLRLSYEHGSEDGLKIKLLFFDLGRGKSEEKAPKENKKERQKPEKKNKPELKQPTTDEPLAEAKDETVIAETKEADAAEEKESKAQKPAASGPQKEDGRKDDAKPKEKKKDKKPKKEKTESREGGIIDNIKSAVEALKENKPAVSFILRKLKSLLRHILPGSHYIRLVLGLNDPATLGEILGAAAIVRASTNLMVDVCPVFDRQVVEADFRFKGRIVLAKVLYICLVTYFNKDVQALIKQIKN